MNREAFMQLVADTRKAFEQSDIKGFPKKGCEWNYSICYKIIPHRPLILGFNDGVSDKQKIYPPDDKYPSEMFMEVFNRSPEDFGSMRRSINRLKTCTCFSPAEMNEMGYGNFCFFRSKNAAQIKDSDLKRCSPLFVRFLELAKPSMLLVFSRQLIDHLDKRGLIKSSVPKDISFPKGRQTVKYTAIKGEVSLGSTPVPFISLPHPAYPMNGDARETAWRFCFQ